MPRDDAGVSIADLMSAGLRLRPSDAATIVREIALQVESGALPGVPSTHVIRLLPGGEVSVGGPVATGGHPVRQAAHLLNALLPHRPKSSSSDAAPLRRLIERALTDTADGMDLLSMGGFADGLRPYSAHEPAALVEEILQKWSLIQSEISAADGESTADATASEAAGTVSDLRRARRATGISLAEVARRSRIPLSLLRQLEWGYLRNWPTGLYGRTQLARYARAAGLDRQTVLEAMWPLVLEEERVRRIAPSPSASSTAPIVIVEPTFADDEELFATEEDAVADDEKPQPIAIAEPEPVVATAVPVANEAPVADAVIFRDWPEPVATRRSSTIAAAGLIGVLIGGGIWASRSESLFLPPTHPVDQHARQLPVRTPRSPVAADGPAPTDATHALALPRSASALPVATTGAAGPALTRVSDAALATGNDGEDAGAFDTDGAPVFSTAGEAGGDGPRPLRIARIVDENSRNYNTQLSPDGGRVAFDSDRDGTRAIYVADADGRHLRRLTTEGVAAMPRWSADGRKIAYVRSEADDPSVWNLWTLDMSSGESRRLTSRTAGRLATGSWFADGNRIAYASGGEIRVLDAATNEEARYGSPLAGRSIASPAVSPDGQRIIFQVSRDGGWVLDLADGSMRKVISDPSAGQYTWSPDGTQVAYYSGRDAEWNVWVMASR